MKIHEAMTKHDNNLSETEKSQKMQANHIYSTNLMISKPMCFKFFVPYTNKNKPIIPANRMIFQK